MLYEGINLVHFADVIIKAKYGCGRCSQLAVEPDETRAVL